MKSIASILLLPLFLFVGCESTDTAPAGSSSRPSYVDPTAQGSVSGLGIESQDLITATDKMTRKLMETSALQSTKGNTPVIGLLPVENRTRFSIDKEIFTTRLKALLSEKSTGQYRFIARDRMDALKKEKKLKDAGEVTSGDRQKFLGVDYYLTGELSSLSTSSSQGKSDYVLFTFRLINAETSEEVWEGFHEMKKEGTEDVIYR